MSKSVSPVFQEGMCIGFSLSISTVLRNVKSRLDISSLADETLFMESSASCFRRLIGIEIGNCHDVF